MGYFKQEFCCPATNFRINRRERNCILNEERETYCHVVFIIRIAQYLSTVLFNTILDTCY